MRSKADTEGKASYTFTSDTYVIYLFTIPFLYHKRLHRYQMITKWYIFHTTSHTSVASADSRNTGNETSCRLSHCTSLLVSTYSVKYNRSSIGQQQVIKACDMQL